MNKTTTLEENIHLNTETNPTLILDGLPNIVEIF